MPSIVKWPMLPMRLPFHVPGMLQLGAVGHSVPAMPATSKRLRVKTVRLSARGSYLCGWMESMR